MSTEPRLPSHKRPSRQWIVEFVQDATREDATADADTVRRMIARLIARNIARPLLPDSNPDSDDVAASLHPEGGQS